LAVLAVMLPGEASARTRKISAEPVTFSVQNVNRSKLTCTTDGASYQIKGHLVGPRSVLATSSRKRKRKPAVTLYLHGLGFGEWFWRFNGFADPGPHPAIAIPHGYDYAAAQAKAGHTSVVIDRLGYDASGHPDGTKSCLGGQADVAHQIVQQLRAGSYAVDGGRVLRFKRIALAGHSAGAETAMIEAYSFRDVDALLAMSFSYSNLPRAQLALGPTYDLCRAGGEPASAGLPTGYAYYGGPTAADFLSIMLASSPSTADIAAVNRNRDPCGDVDSIIPALGQQSSMLRRIKVPVLVICGTKDALYSRLGCEQQAERFSGSRSNTLAFVRGAGHGLTLERQAPKFRRKVGRWLAKRGF
jgi:pimeloyl-ACP methyl ester carboxylesterase